MTGTLHTILVSLSGMVETPRL